MALTLAEAAKQLPPGEEFRAEIQEAYAKSHPILDVLPMIPIKGGAVRYNVEQSLPGMSFRGVNEPWTESTGITNPVVESLVIAGGEAKVDAHIIRTRGEETMASTIAAKLKSLAHTVGHKFIKGDSDVDAREFDGLQKRIGGAKKIAPNTGNTNGPISWPVLDELLDLVEEPTHLIMSRAMRRNITTGARDPAKANHYSMDYDRFGQRVERWNGIPILFVDRNMDLFASLAFDEADYAGSGSTFTSIYCVSFREGGVTGLIGEAGMQVDMIGAPIGAVPAQGVRLEWDVGFAFWTPHCAARVAGITNAAAVATKPS